MKYYINPNKVSYSHVDNMIDFDYIVYKLNDDVEIEGFKTSNPYIYIKVIGNEVIDLHIHCLDYEVDIYIDLEENELFLHSAVEYHMYKLN